MKTKKDWFDYLHRSRKLNKPYSMELFRKYKRLYNELEYYICLENGIIKDHKYDSWKMHDDWLRDHFKDRYDRNNIYFMMSNSGETIFMFKYEHDMVEFKLMYDEILKLN